MNSARASLIASCPDTPGIIFEITQLLFQHGANIAHLEQHIEDGMFFFRTECERERFDIGTEAEVEEVFQGLTQKYQITLSVDFGERKKRVGLLCSRETHCLVDILGRTLIGELPFKVVYVLGNFEEAEAVVKPFGIPFFCVPTGKDFTHEEAQLSIVRDHPTDVLGLARYMKVLSADFLTAVGQKVINVHHSFLPSFIGAKPYHDAYERGVKLIGATAHYVIPELDRGPIIEQHVRRITHGHNIEKIKLMGRESEKEAFAFALRKHAENKLVIFKNRVIVFE